MKTPVLPKRFRSLSSAAIFALLGLPLHSATVTWDNTNGTNAWSTAANWDTNIEPVAADDVILPAGLAATLTLIAGEFAKTLAINDNYTLTGGGLTLASASTISVLLGKTASVATPITITGGTTNTGDGVLTLNGSNTFTGGILVNAGTLRVSNANAIGASTNTATVNAGAILEVTNAITFDRSITLNHGGTVAGSGATAISNGKITIDLAATAVTLATSAAGDVFTVGNGANDVTGGTAATTINVTGPGAVRLGAASDFDGSWNVASGARLELGATAALGDTAASGVTLAGGALAGRLASATTFTGQTNLTLTASSSLISDRSSASAGVAYTFGTIAMGAHTLTVAPGANATSGTAAIVVGNVTLSGDATFAVSDLNAASGKLTTGSLIGGGVARVLTKTGNGDFAITGGATDLIAGSTFGATGGGNVDLLFPALGAGASVAVTAAQHPLGAAAMTMSDGTLNLLADGDGTTAAQTFTLANGLTLGGSIVVDPARRSGSNTTKTFEIPTLTLGAGAAVGIGGANTYGLRVSGATTLLGNATLQGTALATRTGALTLNGPIGGAFALTIAGGTSPIALTLNAASTYSGGTNVSGGTVTLNAASALGTGALALSGGTIIVNVDNAIAGAVTLIGGMLRVNDNNALVGNTIALNGGTLDLRTNVVTTFSTGTLTLGGDATMNFANNGSGSSLVPTFGNAINVSGNRTLTITNANSFSPNLASLALAGDLTLASAIGVSVQSISQDATPRRFIKAGTGTTTLTGTGTFTGGAEVLAGILSINDTTALGTSVLTVGDTSGVATATARLGVGPSLANHIVVRNGSSGAATLSTTTGGLAWAGNVDLERAGTLEGTSGVTTFGGVISGVGNIVKIGNGEIVLANAANTFGNGTAASVNITGGILTVATDGALGAAANGVTIAAGRVLRASGTFTSARVITPGTGADIWVTAGNVLTLDNGLGGTASFDKADAGTLAFGPAATSTRTALTNLLTGTLRLTGATGLGVASPIAFISGTLDLRNDANTNYGHPITFSSGTHFVNVDRAVGGSATGGTHTLGAITLAAQTLNTTGSNGFGLAIGPTSITGTATLNHDAPGALTVASFDLGGAGGTFSFTMDGDGGPVFVTGAFAETSTKVYNFEKRGTHTLQLGTSFVTRGNIAVFDGTFDFNNLNVLLPAATFIIGGGPLNTPARVVTGTGSLTLGGALDCYSNSTVLGANITGNLNLGLATPTFTISDSGSAPVDLDIVGPISGPAGIGFRKVGAGTLRLSGAGNPFTGLTTVQQGTVELNKSSGDAIGVGGLSINTISSSAATVRLVAANQIHDAAAVGITNTSSTARLDLAGFSETLGATTITATTTSGASITTGATGTLVLGGDLAFANNFSSTSTSTTQRRALITGTGTTTFSATDGTLDLGGAMRNIAVTTTVVSANAANANALIETVIVNGGINKTGPQTLYLTNPANTFSGGLNIAAGIVDLGGAGAAGTGPITFNNTADSQLRLSTGGMTLANPIVISTSGTAEAKLTYSGGTFTTATMSGPITFQRNLVVDVTTGFIDQSNGDLFGRLTLSGNIDGAIPVALLKIGQGVLRLTGTNTHSTTLVQQGTLEFSADTALGTPGARLFFFGGSLHPMTSLATSRELVFISEGSIRVDSPNVLELTGTITPSGNVGFFGGGMTILSGTGGGSGELIVGKYASYFADPGSGTPQIDYGHVLSVRGAFALPTGNIWLQNNGVLELGNGDFTRAVGNGAGQVRVETSIGAGFAAYGADRVVNLGGTGATLIFGDPVTKFLRAAIPNAGFDRIGALILGSATATHTVDFQNAIEFNSGDSFTSRAIRVPNGPSAKEAIISGDLSLNGLPGTPGVYLEIFVAGALDITGDISGTISLALQDSGTLTLTGANTFTGSTTIDFGGTLVVNSDAAFGNAANLVSLYNGATLRAAGNITSNRPFEIYTFGGPNIVFDTNGFNITLGAASTLTGDNLEKIGAGILTIAGAQDYDILTTSGGTTNVKSPLGTGFAIVNANATTNIGTDQTLAALNIGPGAVVTLDSALPAPAASFAAVPEPGTFGLLLLGAPGLWRRRRRQH